MNNLLIFKNEEEYYNANILVTNVSLSKEEDILHVNKGQEPQTYEIIATYLIDMKNDTKIYDELPFSGITKIELVCDDENAYINDNYVRQIYSPLVTSCTVHFISEEPITKIGDSAFHNCYNLKSIEIPNSVTTINSNAFYYCDGLTSITFKSLKAPNITDFSFCNINNDAKFYAPNGSTGYQQLIDMVNYQYCTKETMNFQLIYY